MKSFSFSGLSDKLMYFNDFAGRVVIRYDFLT